MTSKRAARICSMPNDRQVMGIQRGQSRKIHKERVAYGDLVFWMWHISVVLVMPFAFSFS